MIVDHDRKFVFVHIPKTAGTSVGTMLGHSRRPKNPHKVEADTPRIYADYLRFCFVRNPWDRVYSSFNYQCKMAARGVIRDDAIRILLRDNPDMQFEEFVTEHLNHQVVLTHGHLRPQMRWITASNPQFIGRLETMSTDLQFLRAAVGLEKVELPHRNRSTHESYTEQYTPAMIDKVARLYANDIRFLNYGFEPSV
jgi:hypothetical protein